LRAAALALLVLSVSACSSSGSKGASITVSSTTAPAATTTAPAPKLTVLVTNDDGYAADGIDLIVQELLKLPNITVTVVAPAKNRSGSGSTTTPGALTATVQKTKSGYRAIAVDGFPADTITYALDEVLSEPPDLVVSGINFGQNIGPFVGISGTVGAAKAAAAKGIPAIAASSGATTNTDYAAAARVVIGYVTTHRADYDGSTDDAQVININVPTCTTGSVRGVKQVPAAADLSGRDIGAVDCNSTASSPGDDVDAFIEGFAALTVLDASGTTVTATTAWTGS
jgi:5'-nucleotidase